MAEPGQRPWRILVVDDDPLVGDSIKRMLAVDGHEVEVATTGQEALALFQERDFDLSVLDYEMPGMNGDKLAAAIKALDPRHPILLVSAYPETLALSDDPFAGVDLVMGKPLDWPELRLALTRLLPKE